MTLQRGQNLKLSQTEENLRQLNQIAKSAQSTADAAQLQARLATSAAARTYLQFYPSLYFALTFFQFSPILFLQALPYRVHMKGVLF